MMDVIEDVLMATGALCWAVTAAILGCVAVYEVRAWRQRRRVHREMRAELEELTR